MPALSLLQPPHYLSTALVDLSPLFALQVMKLVCLMFVIAAGMRSDQHKAGVARLLLEFDVEMFFESRLNVPDVPDSRPISLRSMAEVLEKDYRYGKNARVEVISSHERLNAT